MKERNRKVGKILSLFVLIILLIVAIIVIVRYQVLTDIVLKYNQSEENSNVSYVLENDNSIMKYWRKDGIMKLNVKQKSGLGDLTFWKDTNTKEEYLFYNIEPKMYMIAEGGMIEKLVAPMFLMEEPKARFIIAINPTIYIGSKKYKEKKCYFFKADKMEEYAEKETGLRIYSKNPDEVKVEHSFNKVTNQDVEKPDLTKYQKMENNN